MTQRDVNSLPTQVEIDGDKLVLNDEAQAQIVLSKLRSSCEGILLVAQDNISRNLALRFEELEITLGRALNDAMRPIEMRVKDELHQAGFRPRISFPAFHASLFNFSTRQLLARPLPSRSRGKTASRKGREYAKPSRAG